MRIIIHRKNSILLICFSFILHTAAFCQKPEVEIYINDVLQSIDTKMFIDTQSTIKIVIKTEPNSQAKYLLKKAQFEVLCRTKNLKDINFRLKKFQFDSQSSRLKTAPKLSDIAFLWHRYETEPSNSIIIYIYTYEFLQVPDFSRFILHIQDIRFYNLNESGRVQLFNLRNAEFLFRDGISFWRGKGFN